MDVFVAFTIFAFLQGPRTSTTPIYMGGNKELCEQIAEDYNKFYKELDYRKIVCLKLGTTFNPSIDRDEAIYLESASNG